MLKFFHVFLVIIAHTFSVSPECLFSDCNTGLPMGTYLEMTSFVVYVIDMRQIIRFIVCEFPCMPCGEPFTMLWRTLH